LLQDDGKIVIGGSFINYSGNRGRDRLIRLNSDGTEDLEFTQNAVVDGNKPKFNKLVGSLEISDDSKIVVGGLFTDYSGINNLLKLNLDGTLYK
jgi:hypothetical protein